MKSFEVVVSTDSLCTQQIIYNLEKWYDITIGFDRFIKLTTTGKGEVPTSLFLVVAVIYLVSLAQW